MSCCNGILHVDELLSSYDQTKNSVVSLLSTPEVLKEKIWQPQGLLTMDNSCRCSLGAGRTRSGFSCGPCKEIRIMSDLQLGGDEKAFTVECGKQAGVTLGISSIVVSNPHLTKNMVAYNRAVSYVAAHPSVLTCGTPSMEDTQCYSGDSFTIKTLINWKLATVSRHVPTCHTAFICNNVGYSLCRLPTLGTFENLIDRSVYAPSKRLVSPVVRGIFLQLLSFLDSVEQYGFCHGNPGVRACVFDDKPCGYMYNGCRIECPVTLIISDLWNSSAKFDNIHYFVSDTMTELQTSRYYYVPTIETFKSKTAYCDGQTDTCVDGECDDYTATVCTASDDNYYILNNNTAEMFKYIRHYGVPMFVGSFDFYCFIVSFMAHRVFRDTVRADSSLRRLWESMWLPEDIGRIDEQLSDFQKGTSDVVSLLRGKKLQCSVVSNLLKHIKAGW